MLVKCWFGEKSTCRRSSERTILTHFYPEVTVEKMSSLVLEYIGRSSKCYHIGTGNVVYCAYVKKNVFYKSEFEKVSEWDTTIQATMEE